MTTTTRWRPNQIDRDYLEEMGRYANRRANRGQGWPELASACTKALAGDQDALGEALRRGEGTTAHNFRDRRNAQVGA